VILIGKCQICGKEINDKYSLCVACNIESKKSNQQNVLVDIINKINWNMGSVALTLHLQLLTQLETLKYKEKLTSIQEQIHNFLLNKVEKDLKNIKDIALEMEKVT